MKENKQTRKEREFLMHRQEIVDAALELFSEKGFHNVTMHEIARASEFSVGTLYKFFNNKEDLYRALILEKSDEFHFSMMEAIESGRDEIDSIKAYLEERIRLFNENLKSIRLYMAQSRGASFNVLAGLDEELKVKYEEIIARLADVLKRGIRNRLFKKFDPYLLAASLDGMIHAILFQHLDHADEHPFDADMLMRIFFESVMEDS